MTVDLHGARKCILIVDDEADLRELLRLELEPRGWEVLEADGCTAAWRILGSADVGVVLTDLRMPGGTGLDLAEGLRMRGGPHPAVFLMTAYDDVTPEDAEAIGLRGLFNKPFDLEEAVEELESALSP